ncbi:Trichodiene oxygenase, partial [Tolypocladium ophioglossoides CBS 100239]
AGFGNAFPTPNKVECLLCLAACEITSNPFALLQVGCIQLGFTSEKFTRTMIENTLGTEMSVATGVTAALLLFISYLVCKCIYNLYFHPLSNFPGDKVAALGLYYEFYHDVIKDGTYLWRIEEMHKKYGPIVRINANELHIHDPEFYPKIYAGSSRRVDKYPAAVAAYTVPTASLSTIDHDHHRLRRGILAPYFSKRSVTVLEPTINERVDRLCQRLEGAIASGEPIDLDAASAALTADIVSLYFYGKNYDYLGNKDFKFVVRDAIVGLIRFYNFTRFFPALANFIKSLPIPIIRLINPGAANLLISQIDIKREIVESLKDKEKIKTKSVIVGALEDPEIPAQEKTLDRLVDEGTTVIFAGTETTARSISVAIFYLLNNKALLQTLREELSTVTKGEDGQYPLQQLEALPFLTGCVQEGLRLAHGPAIRLPRIAPEEALRYGDWLSPPGTPVSESTILIHLDPTIFPNPKVFDPDRWVRAEKEGIKLRKYIVSFTKGTRVCLGINLAYAELYIAIAKIASSFDMELFETTEDDLEVYHIRLTGYPRKGNGEVKAKIVRKLS